MNDAEYLMQKMARAFEMREGRKFYLAREAVPDRGGARRHRPVPRQLRRPANESPAAGAAGPARIGRFGRPVDGGLLLRHLRRGPLPARSRRPRVLRLRDRALPEAPARAGDQGVLPRELRHPARGIRGRRQQCLRHQHVARWDGRRTPRCCSGRSAGRSSTRSSLSRTAPTRKRRSRATASAATPRCRRPRPVSAPTAGIPTSPIRSALSSGTGRTPLHRAAYEGRLEAAEVLIVLGADRRLKTRSGKRPLQVARLDCRHLKEQ